MVRTNTFCVSRTMVLSISIAMLLHPGEVFGQLSCGSVTQRISIGTQWDCAFPPFCFEDYGNLPQLASRYRQPISEAQLWGQILRIATGRVGQQNPPDLRNALLDGLNIR